MTVPRREAGTKPGLQAGRLTRPGSAILARAILALCRDSHPILDRGAGLLARRVHHFLPEARSGGGPIPRPKDRLGVVRPSDRRMHHETLRIGSRPGSGAWLAG